MDSSPFYIVSKHGVIRTYFRSFFFGIVSYLSSFGVGYITVDLSYFNHGREYFSFLTIVLLPALIASFFNLRLNSSSKYRKNILSMISFSLSVSLVFIAHIVLLVENKEYDKKMLFALGFIFMISFSLAHLSYLLVLITSKKTIQEDLIDN